MKYISTICSDVGISKKINQDAAMVLQAKTETEQVLFAVVCDGMGGLQKGELASATVIEGMKEWFENVFPSILNEKYTFETIKNSWLEVLSELNTRIRKYGQRLQIDLGTTITALLLIEDAYYICNVGDSRIYTIKQDVRQLTRDQSYVQREIDMGRMTEEEALQSNKRSILLQCIGVEERVLPDFYSGEYKKDTNFLLCSDGFIHVITKEELFHSFNPAYNSDKEDMEQKNKYLIDVVKNRGETDNITSILISAK